MWGTHVESEIRQAENQAKTDNERKRKVEMVLTRLFKEESEEEENRPPPKGKFRDPAEVIGKKG